jgi:hypothetical protein
MPGRPRTLGQASAWILRLGRLRRSPKPSLRRPMTGTARTPISGARAPTRDMRKPPDWPKICASSWADVGRARCLYDEPGFSIERTRHERGLHCSVPGSARRASAARLFRSWHHRALRTGTSERAGRLRRRCHALHDEGSHRLRSFGHHDDVPASTQDRHRQAASPNLRGQHIWASSYAPLRQFCHRQPSGRRPRPSSSMRPQAHRRSAQASAVRGTSGIRRARTRAHRSRSGSQATPRPAARS